MQRRMAGKGRFAELERRADVSEIAKPASEEREGREGEGLLALSEELSVGVTALSDTKTSSMRMMTAFTR